MGGGGNPTLTPTGVAVVVGAVALGVLGWSLGYVALTVLAAGAVVALLAGWWAARQLPRLDVDRAVEPGRVERGLPAHGVVAVRNPGRRRSRPCAAVDHVAGRRVSVDIPALAPGKTVAVSTDLPTNRRGEHQVGPLTLTRHDPFGLWRSERSLGRSTVVLVQPRVLAIDPRPAGRTRHVEGPVSDTAPRGTQTFHSLREYTAGDDVRRVHWRSSARMGTLMVREHIDTSLPSTVVVLDACADHYETDGFEEAVDVAASVVAAAQRHGFPVRLIASSGETAVARAGQRGQQLRDVLTRLQPTADATLATATTSVSRARDRDVIVVVAGRLTVADLGQVTTMGRRFATPTLVTIDAAGLSPTPTWPSGPHLRGVNAATALARWSTARAA